MVSPVWYAWDGASFFVVGKERTSYIRNLRRDPRCAELLQRFDTPRVPGGWEPFELVVRTIIGQGVSVAAARTFGGRLATRYGEACDAGDGLSHTFPSPRALRSVDLTSIGLTRARANAIRQLASRVSDGVIDLAAPTSLDAIAAIAGIGPWTVAYVALRGFGQPDSFPAEDLVLRRVLDVTSAAQARRAAEPWRPWRGYAAMLLWQSAC